MDISRFLSDHPDYRGQAVHSTSIPKRKPRHERSRYLDVRLVEKLDQAGIKLYSHQARAIDEYIRGRNVCISTSTASGKTLAYALTCAHTLLTRPNSTVLMVYPTKALARDQKEELGAIFSDLDMDISLGIYDGDVTASAKVRIREEADIILTNFTGLNLYLGFHKKWGRFYQNLQSIVIDEAHHYTGLLGMHVAWIARRLLRVVGKYGQEPKLILSSATLGNPGEHSRNLTGQDFTVVDNDGSGHGRRDIIIWNPPRLQEKLGERKSTHRESSELLAYLVDRGLQTLMFASSRKMTELNCLWTRHMLDSVYKHRGDIVEPYNAALPREKRRDIERRLREGGLLAVVSTNALELGMNIGSMDATLLSGYPGSNISFWQQMGRAGRGEGEALSIMVPFNSALDQYLVDHPEHILDGNIEIAVIDLANNHVFSQHLLAAANEIPLGLNDQKIFGERLKGASAMWKQEGSLVGELHQGTRYIGDKMPQQSINIYSMGRDTFEVIIMDGKGKKVQHPIIHKRRAYRDFHPNAIYLYQGVHYRVMEFHQDSRPRVVLEPTAGDLYTQSVEITSIGNIRKVQERRLGGFNLCKGRGTVNIQYPFYRTKHISNDVQVSMESNELEPIEIDTCVTWLEIPERERERIMTIASKQFSEEISDLPVWPGNERKSGPVWEYHGCIHAAEHSIIHMMPLLMLIDERDIGGISTDEHPEIGSGAIFIYDGVEGGVGFAYEAYHRFPELARMASQRMNECSCKSLKGCPACTFAVNCGNDNRPLNRMLAVELLQAVGAEQKR